MTCGLTPMVDLQPVAPARPRRALRLLVAVALVPALVVALGLWRPTGQGEREA